jgi:hypothetical protein
LKARILKDVQTDLNNTEMKNVEEVWSKEARLMTLILSGQIKEKTTAKTKRRVRETADKHSMNFVRKIFKKRERNAHLDIANG